MHRISRLLIAISLSILPAAGFAHGTHAVELEGHSHLLAGAAIGALVVLAVLAIFAKEPIAASEADDAATGDAPYETADR